MRTPFPYQTQGSTWLREHSRGLLMDDPGLGKSTQALMALPQSTQAVVVCPSVVKSVWLHEISVCRPDLKVSVLSGRGSFRWPDINEIVVLNFDILPKKLDANPLPGTHLIGDEIHYCKNAASQRSKAFRELALAVHRDQGKVWGLSATPMTSFPPDLFGVYRALLCETDIFGSYRNFFFLFRGYETPYGVKWGQPRGEVPDLLKPFSLGRKREQVLPQLPTKVYSQYRAKIGKVKEADDVSSAAVDEAMRTGKVDGAVSAARAALALKKAQSPDVEEYIRYLSEDGSVVVFSLHRAAAEYLAEKFGTVAITGSVPTEHREGIINQFKAGAFKVLVGTIGAMGVGVTLTVAHRAVFVDRAWTPAENKQAEDRVCRIGQTRGVEIIDIVANHALDERVFQLLKTKTRIADGSVEAARVDS